MRLLAVVLLLAGCAEEPVRFKLPSNPTFLVAGQSNAVSPAQGHAPYWSQTGLVSVTDVYNGRVLRIPTQATPVDSSIAWIYLGDYLQRPVTLINVATGNTSTQKWVDVNFAQDMAPALRKQRFDAVLWVQGESDIGERIDEDQTYENMRTIILRSRTIQPGLVWFIALNSHKTTPKDNSVRRAQLRLIADSLALQGPDTDSLRDTPEWVETSFGEFVGEGLRQHGRLWYEVLKQYL